MTQKILVADDSSTMRQVVTMAFKGSGFEVVAVEGGAEALQAGYEHHPALVVLDYHLPDRSGLDVCRAMKGDPNLRNTPILMLGGKFHAFSEDEARQAGADDVIVKPFKTDAIMEKVAALIASAGARPAQPVAPPAAAPRQAPSPGMMGGAPAPARQAPMGAERHQSTTSPGEQPAAGGRLPQRGFGGGRSRFRQADAPAPNPTPVAPSRRPTPAGLDPAAPRPEAQSRFGGRPAPSARSGSGSTVQPVQSRHPQAPVRQSAPAPAPTPAQPVAPAVMQPAAPAAAQIPIDPDEIARQVRAEVQKAVKEQLLIMVKTVLGDLFKEKMMPRLLKYGEDRIENIVATDLQVIMQERVEEELAKLTGE